MAKFKTKTKDCQLIVKAKLSFGERINEDELNNFSRKYVRGLLQVKKVKKNLIEYSGPVGISLYNRLKKPISKYEFFFIMEQIIDLTQKIMNVDLEADKVIFNIHHIYINEQTKELQFIYLPLLQPARTINLFELMYNIIYLVTPVQEQDEGYISRFTYFLKGLQFFDPEEIESYIVKEDCKVVNIIKKHNVGQSGFMTDKPKDYYEHYDKKNEDGEETGLLGDDEATGLLQDDEETGLLSDDTCQVRYPTLLRVLTDEVIIINKPVFRLGKERSYSDYFVGNNNMVSRSHADIVTREQRYFIMDLNSTNKTYVNGVPITVRQEIEIKDGDSIRLGNEEFVFHI